MLEAAGKWTLIPWIDRAQCLHLSLVSRVDLPNVARKYWDEDYVRSLEDQVQALLALQKNASGSQAANSANSENEIKPTERPVAKIPIDSDRSSMAMEELSVMLWRTNLGDAVTIGNEDAVEQTSPFIPISTDVQLQPPIPPICEDNDRLYRLAKLFLDCINSEHQFTQYTSSDFLHHYPQQPLDRLFLHSAILAAGATFERESDSLSVGDAFAAFSESLVFSCLRHALSIYSIQGMCILSWRSLALGRDHFGWVFLSMAAGMAVHLRLHVLASDDMEVRPTAPAPEDVQTFWSFYMTDRTSISILGRNCVLPWRRVNVPAIETIFADTEDLGQISFAWQCKLWHMHDRSMDEMYVYLPLGVVLELRLIEESRFSSTFDTIAFTHQVELLMSIHGQLGYFFKTCDVRLRIKRGFTAKPILLFHMAYQMATLVTIPPFLRLLTREKDRPKDAFNAMSLALRSISNAASSMVRLVHLYRLHYTFEHANPLLIHHLLSATIVHLMNTTSKSRALRRHSTRSVRKCLTLLEELKQLWPVRCAKSIAVIKSLAVRWGVESVAQPEIHIFQTETTGLGATSTEDIYSEIGHPQGPSIDVFAEHDIFNMGIDLGMERDYDFVEGHEPVAPNFNINISDYLPDITDMGDLNWLFTG
ncbi:hypothetical protein N7456_009648 [Penicillium angulare]|uniref:Xylanolytic transcriptional activator regulatory domain-containing protein n=1 Tax=Penicillium angulare TaxID=116970 RepID=A0A9W9F5A4_9EURO|nr:hypothetical protein N7456_009648 [Penicillium angulare]